MAMLLKICGITRLADARHAVQHGATALGFVFWPRSPRYIGPEEAAEIVSALPQQIMTVGVFVNEPLDGIGQTMDVSGVGAVQLHGDEPPVYAGMLQKPLLRAMSLETPLEAWSAWPAETTFLLDAADPERRGGTGQSIDWARAAVVARGRRVVLAGGLGPSNVADAVATVRPFGVDVSSGVEQSPGVKDVDKMARFLENARRAFEEQGIS